MKVVACSRRIKIISTLLGCTLAIRKYYALLGTFWLGHTNIIKYIRGEGGVDFDIAVRAIKQTRVLVSDDPVPTPINHEYHYSCGLWPWLVPQTGEVVITHF